MSDKNQNRRKKQQRTDLSIRILRELYRGVDGRGLSLKYRKELAAEGDISNKTTTVEGPVPYDDSSLTYGEIIPQTFLQILNFIENDYYRRRKGSHLLKKSSWSFVDLGSGTGRACMTAALSAIEFDTVLGIELVPSLHHAAVAIKSSLDEILHPSASIALHHQRSINNRSSYEEAAAEFDTTAVHILTAADNQQITVEAFANNVCRVMGHKKYKTVIKKHKSLVMYLSSRNDQYSLSSDKLIVRLKLQSDATGEIESTTSNTASLSAAAAAAEVTPGAIPSGNSLLSTTPTASLTTTAAETEATKKLQLNATDLSLLQPMPTISFECGSIFDVNWWDHYDVAYAASLLFSEEMMKQLADCALHMKPGSYFISLKPLCDDTTTSTVATLISESFFRMSWQMAKVFIYRIDDYSIPAIDRNSS